MGIEYSAHLPSEFIAQNANQLLPEWLVPVLSILVVMQRCQVALVDRTVETEQQKQRLRRQFIEFGHQISASLHSLGHRAEIFDPKTGEPLLSQAGAITLDDVAVVQALLGYPLVETEGGCWILEHPNWGTGVFPAVLMSSAEPEVLTEIAHQVAYTF